MSDTMRDAPIGHLVALPGKPFAITVPVGKMALLEGHHNAPLYLAAAPAPPVPSSVQEIMPLVNAYTESCMKAAALLEDGVIDEADSICRAALKPLQAALVALVDDNHRLKFELDGINAMRRPAMEEHAARWMWARKNLLSACFQSGKHNSGQTSITPTGEANTDWYWDKIADQFRGIAPEQGENHGND